MSDMRTDAAMGATNRARIRPFPRPFRTRIPRAPGPGNLRARAGMPMGAEPGGGLGAVAFPAVVAVLLAYGTPAVAAGGGEPHADRARSFVGAFAGVGRTGNRLIDVDGFADWGSPGSTSTYDDTGLIGGVLAGRTFEAGSARFRVEIDAAFGELSASTTDLDPTCPDEAARSRLRWIATLRGGVEESVGPATLFVNGGLAAARVTNSVTDTDYRGSCLERELHSDPDDSFRDSSTELGWVFGVGMEARLAAAWALRFDGSYMDFGRNRYSVNRSGNNGCGPGGARRPCSYDVENRLGVLRLALVYRFGG